MDQIHNSTKNFPINSPLAHLYDLTNSLPDISPMNHQNHSTNYPMMNQINNSTENLSRNWPMANLHKSPMIDLNSNNSTNNSTKNLPRNSPINHFTYSTNDSMINQIYNPTKNLPRNSPINHFNYSTNDSMINQINNSTMNLPKNSTQTPFNSPSTDSNHQSILTSPTKMIIKRLKKSRRKMHYFTKTQRCELEANFQMNVNPSQTVTKGLALKFGKTNEQIRQWFNDHRRRRKNKNSGSTAHASTNSQDPIIFCSDCPTCLAQQNPVNPPSPIPSTHESPSTFNPQPFNPQPYTPQSPPPCPSCQSFSTIMKQNFPDNSMASYVEVMNQLMHIPWTTNHPIVANWPDFSDLYRKMDDNLRKFLNELI